MAHAKYETKCFSCDRNWRFERRPDRSRAGFGFIWNKSPFRHRRRVNRPPSGSCRRCCRLCARYFPAFFYRDVSGNCLLRGEPLAGFFERALVDLWLVLRCRNRSSNDANRFAALGPSGAWSLQTSRPASRHWCTHDYRRAPDFLQRVAVREPVSGLDQFITRISLGEHHFAHRFQTKPRITQMKQIGILLLSAVLIFAVTALGQDTKSAANGSPTAGDAVYARPGQLVSAADGARLNLYCMGAARPPSSSIQDGETGRQRGRRCSHRSQSGRAPAAMTVPARDLAIRVPCRAPACALRRSYILRCIVPGSPGPTFWWDPPLAATTYALLPTCTWARLRGWYWLTLIPMTSNRGRCEKRHIEHMLGFPPACAMLEP